MEGSVSANAERLFGDSVKYLYGTKCERLHLRVSDEADKKIRTESEALGITLSEYLIYQAIVNSFAGTNRKLDEISEKVDEYMKKKNIPEVEEAMDENNIKADKTAEKKEKKQFHLRITPEAYAEVERKAAACNMTFGQYVTFVVTNFDIMEISKKVDDISRKLDIIAEKEHDEVEK